MIPLQSVFDLVRQPLLAIGPKGEWLYSNPAFIELLGIETGRASGGLPPFSWWPPELRDDYAALLARLVADEDPSFAGRTWRVELLHSAGHRIDMTLLYDVVRDYEANPILHFFLAPNLTPFEGAPERYREGLDRIALELGNMGIAPLEPRRASEGAALARSLLSPRESEVLNELLGGGTVRDIAAKLLISAYTVRNHLKSIYRKLGVHSQRELLVRFRDSI